MANNFYTSVGGLDRRSIMLQVEPSGPNVARLCEVLHPDADGIFQILDTDQKAAAKVSLMGTYIGVNIEILGPFATRELAVTAQTPE